MLENDKLGLDMDRVTLYELAFNIIPTVGDDDVKKIFKKVTEFIEKIKIENIIMGEPALVSLKYNMTKTIDSKKNKYDKAYFAWVKFDADPVNIEPLKEKLDHVSEILRYVIFKSDKESNISPREVAEMISGKKDDSKAETEPKEEIREEKADVEIVEPDLNVETSSDDEVDKAIDDLVVDDTKGGVV